MNENRLGHLEFWTHFRRYVEDHKIDIRLSKPGKSASSNVDLRRCYFSVRPWRLLKDNRLGVSVQFDGPDPRARYEGVAQQDRQKVDDRLSPLGMLDWQPGKVSLSRFNTASISDTHANATRNIIDGRYSVYVTGRVVYE